MMAAIGIDFEGTIGLNRRDKGTGIHRFTTTVSISGTSKELLESFKERIGFGHCFPATVQKEKSSPTWRWVLFVSEIKLLLPKIEPFLVLKQEQAKHVTRALQILKSRAEMNSLKTPNQEDQYTLEEYEELNYIWARVTELNAKPFTRLPDMTDSQKLLSLFRMKGLK
jgi:hypothetical protein